MNDNHVISLTVTYKYGRLQNHYSLYNSAWFNVWEPNSLREKKVHANAREPWISFMRISN